MSFIDYLIKELNIAGNIPLTSAELLEIMRKINQRMIDNDFDRGMDDSYLGKEPKGDPGLEYLRGFDYAESLYKDKFPDQVDDRVQEDDRVQ